MISDVPRQRGERRRRHNRRSIAEEQESLKSVLDRKDSTGSVTVESTENHSNNNKELDATQLRNITNAQLHSNNNNPQDESTYTSHFTFKSSTNQEPDNKDYSSRSHSNDSRTSEDSGISSTTTRSRYGNRYKRGYYSEGSALRERNTQDATEDSLSSSYGFRNRKNEDTNKEDLSSSSSLHSRTTDAVPNVSSVPSSEIKYRYTNGSSCDMPSDEPRCRRKYNISDDFSSTQHSSNSIYHHKDDHYGNTTTQNSGSVDYYNKDTNSSNSNSSSVLADALSSDSSISSTGTLTITLSGPDGQSETSIHSSPSPPEGDALGQMRLDVAGQTVPRLEGDNISLSSTMSSLSTSSVITTDSCSTVSSDFAKRQSVSSLSDLEHLGRSTCLSVMARDWLEDVGG